MCFKNDGYALLDCKGKKTINNMADFINLLHITDNYLQAFSLPKS